MKRLSAACILLLATSCPWLTLAQDDDSLDVDDLFEEDFESEPTATINDPIEKLNRAIFKFNDGLYTHVVKPFSRTYTKIMPDPVERGVDNVFDNLKFPSRFASNILQGKLTRAGQETGKFVVNTTIGIGGILKPSRNFENLNPPEEDIGQAFGAWGIGHGFYFVMPILGPTSMRDFVGNIGDETVQPIPQPWSQIDDDGTRYALIVVETVNDLPSLMDLYDSMKRSSIDPYSAVRDAYAQRRARQVEE